MRSADDPHDALGELIRFGTIESVDLAGGRLTVRVGDIVTGRIRWLQGAAGGTHVWIRPKAGEQVTLLAAGGDIEGAIALPGMVSDAHPPIGDQDRDVIRFEDGAEIAYDPATHALTAILPDGATARIQADGGITLIGDVAIQGNLSLTGDATIDGKVTTQGEVQSGAIKLTTHKHGQVQPGGGVSGVPQ